MSVLVSKRQRQLPAELEGVPEEYYPFLLQMDEPGGTIKGEVST